MIWKKVGVGAAMVGVVALFLFGIWFMFFHQTNTPTSTTSPTKQNTQIFGTPSNSTGNQNQTPTVTGGTPNTSTPTAQKIFKIADGPVQDAVFIQTFHPTTTLARYVMQDSGHVLDIPVDVPGAFARIISNTTIPGLGNAQWLTDGGGVYAQYYDSGTTKTVFLGLPTGTASSSIAVRFLPDNIISFAPSPDGKSVAYVLLGGGTAVGYLAKADGSNPVKLFTSPLSQVLISWPSTKTILLQSKEAYGVPGVAFSVSATTGALLPIVYTNGLSASANFAFSKILYQSTPPTGVRTTYAHDVKSGKDLQMPFNPFPEKCVWDSKHTTVLYCAAPLASTPANYLDLWYQGLYGAADSIFQFDIGQGVTSLTATPGGSQGGVQANIASLHISPDGKYLLYVTKGDRSLWGVRLAD